MTGFKLGDRVRFYDEEIARVHAILGDPAAGWGSGTIVGIYGMSAVIHWDDTDTTSPVPLAELEPDQVGEPGK